jgi:hypothetical protein
LLAANRSLNFVARTRLIMSTENIPPGINPARRDDVARLSIFSGLKTVSLMRLNWLMRRIFAWLPRYPCCSFVVGQRLPAIDGLHTKCAALPSKLSGTAGFPGGMMRFL